MQVLLAVQDPSRLEQLTSMLLDLGHDPVGRVMDAHEAGELAGTTKVDLVLSGFPILAKGGFALLKQLRQGSNSSLPVLAVIPDLSPEALKSLAKYKTSVIPAEGLDARSLEIKMREVVAGSQGEDALSRAHYKQGLILLDVGEHNASIVQLVKAIKLRKRFPEALKALSEAFHGQGEMERAGHFLTASAEASVLTGRDWEAMNTLIELRHANPRADNPFLVVACRYRDRGDTQSMLSVLRRGLALQPDSSELQRALSEADAWKGVVASDDDEWEEDPDRFSEEGSVCSSQWKAGKGAQNFADEPAVEGPYQEKRRAPRTPLFDYFVSTSRSDDSLPVLDISKMGIGFKPQGESFTVDETLTMDLETLDRVKIKKLHVRVARVAHNVVGCEFKKLSSKQESQILKLVEGATKE